MRLTDTGGLVLAACLGLGCAVQVADGQANEQALQDGGPLADDPWAAGGAGGGAAAPATGGSAWAPGGGAGPSTGATAGGGSGGATDGTGGGHPVAGAPGTGGVVSTGGVAATGGAFGTGAMAGSGSATDGGLPPPVFPEPVDVTTLPASPSNPAECPDVAPENPVGDCLGLPIYLNCVWGDSRRTYSCVCDWYHWLCI